MVCRRPRRACHTLRSRWLGWLNRGRRQRWWHCLERLVLDYDRWADALHAVFDQLHDNRPALRLLHLALAVPEGHRAGRPLAAFARRAFPEPAKIVLQALVRTFHGPHDSRVTRSPTRR